MLTVNSEFISILLASELFISLESLCVLCVLVRLNHSDATVNDITIPIKRGFDIKRGLHKQNPI